MKNKFTRILGYALIAIFFSIALSGCDNSNLTVDNISTNKVNSSTPTTSKDSTVPKIEYKTITENEIIPFKTVKYKSYLLEKGKSEVATEGKNGAKAVTYKLTITDGKETAREKLYELTSTHPTSRIIRVGVASDLSWNSRIDPSSPSSKSLPSLPTAPRDTTGSTDNYDSRATAICNDGTTSYSTRRSGTCSHHGGVAQWL